LISNHSAAPGQERERFLSIHDGSVQNSVLFHKASIIEMTRD